jgi:hypothetical protein
VASELVSSSAHRVFLEVCDSLTFPYEETLFPLPRMTSEKELFRIFTQLLPI